MIVEERNYTLKPECLEDYLNVYEKEGMPSVTIMNRSSRLQRSARRSTTGDT